MAGPEVVAHGTHAVYFYETDAELAALVVPYLAAGERSGETVVVIAEESHRDAFQAGLAAEGGGLAAAQRDEFVWLDAATTLSAFMHAGRLDAAAFDEVVGGVVRRAARRGGGVRAYGEMVALLWGAGDVLGAIELERLWNDLAREQEFALLCAYPAASVAHPDRREAFCEVCDLHTAVLPSPRARAGAREADMRLSADDRAPAKARSFVRATLARWGIGDRIVQHAEIVSSELTTNAVRHGAHPSSLVLCAGEGALRVAVSDATPPPGAPWAVNPTHGLSIIGTICARWGVEPTSHGKTVWAELPLTAASSG